MSNDPDNDVPEENNPKDDNTPTEDFPGSESDSSLADKMPKIIRFDQLARCGDEIWIECNGQIYRLRRTRQNKLILTK